MLLDMLCDPACWEAFYAYKTSLIGSGTHEKDLRAFIDRAAYLPVAQRIAAGEPFPLPCRSVISKQSSQKKRVVYTYPPEENQALKLLTFLLLRKYDGLFAENLYSFRPGVTAKDAVRRLTRLPGMAQMYAYKADISNYFNSVPVELLLPLLRDATADDPELFAFLRGLLEEPYVLDQGRKVIEEKGIMAGTPLSAFYANLFLAALDRLFAARGIPYARYSDDVIVFAPTPELTRQYAAEIRALLAERKLQLNPEKERFFTPDEGWTFLGFHVCKNEVDIAPASVEKMKQKMRRKTKALRRWQKRNGLPGEKAAAAFIRVFNKKLLEAPQGSELSWSRWFFPVLTTADSLQEIDHYAQDCIRYLCSSTHTKARFNVRYEELKALGYRSLVHAYYADRNAEPAEQ